MDPVSITPTRQDYAGVSYYLCGRYFQHKGERLHRRVWADAHGPIPDGYHVHHVNHDRADNRLENLSLLPGRDHVGYHGKQMTPARLEAASRKAPALHAGNARMTTEQRADAARRGWERVEAHAVTCQVCGREFHTAFPSRARFCGGTCRARARRARLRAQG